MKIQFALCLALGVVPLVRVPGTEYDFIGRALDCGALGVKAPLVDTAEQATFIASSTTRPRAATLMRAREIALQAGLRDVCTGNVHDLGGGTTSCPLCGEAGIVRGWFQTKAVRLASGWEMS